MAALTRIMDTQKCVLPFLDGLHLVQSPPYQQGWVLRFCSQAPFMLDLQSVHDRWACKAEGQTTFEGLTRGFAFHKQEEGVLTAPQCSTASHGWAHCWPTHRKKKLLGHVAGLWRAGTLPAVCNAPRGRHNWAAQSQGTSPASATPRIWVWGRALLTDS